MGVFGRRPKARSPQPSRVTAFDDAGNGAIVPPRSGRIEEDRALFRLPRQHLPLADRGWRDASPRRGGGALRSNPGRERRDERLPPGEPPDRRATAAAKRRGIDIKNQGKQFKREDLVRFDYVLAMDQDNLEDLLALDAQKNARR